MLNDVGIEVPKCIETNSMCRQTRQGMIACNNHNMRNPISLHQGDTHVMIFACYHALSASMLFVSILFGTSITTSFNMLVKNVTLYMYVSGLVKHLCYGFQSHPRQLIFSFLGECHRVVFYCLVSLKSLT